MIIFPAIDLKDSKCVRLFKGEMSQATVFNDDPASQALEFQKQGFKYLHLVDLNGAIEGESRNIEAIKSIINSVKIPIQLGGGIRNLESIENWLALGVSRIILGSVAAKNPGLVKEACKKFPDKIIVGIDSKDNKVATEGWVSLSEVSTIDLAKKYEDAGVASIIYTDISRDGTLSGVDLEGTENLAQNVKIPIIASGGVSSIHDLEEIAKLQTFGVIGSIVGRAIYEKKITLAEIKKFL